MFCDSVSPERVKLALEAIIKSRFVTSSPKEPFEELAISINKFSVLRSVHFTVALLETFKVSKSKVTPPHSQSFSRSDSQGLLMPGLK